MSNVYRIEMEDDFGVAWDADVLTETLEAAIARGKEILVNELGEDEAKGFFCVSACQVASDVQ